jgi:ABC-type Fe3+-hydroxamate transport system substrate-binding protein
VTILARAPEVIIELHYSDTASREAEASEREAWNMLPGVPAVKNGRIHLLYGGELVVPGPRVVLTARAFARALHPDVVGVRSKTEPLPGNRIEKAVF